MQRSQGRSKSIDFNVLKFLKKGTFLLALLSFVSTPVEALGGKREKARLIDLGLIASDLGIAAAHSILTSEGDVLIYITTKEESPARLIVYNLTKKNLEKIIHLGNAVQAWGIDADETGNIYVGTRDSDKTANVYRYNPSTDELCHFFCIKDDSLVWSIVINKKVLYAGTYPNAKLFSYDMETKTLKNLGCPIKGETSIRCLSLSSNHDVVAGMGSHAGCAVFSTERKCWEQLSYRVLKDQSYVYSCFADKKRIILGTQPKGNVLIINAKNMELMKIINTSDATVDAVTVDSDESIYFTTRPRGDLYRFHMKHDSLEKLATPVYRDQTRFIQIQKDEVIGVADSGYVWAYSKKDRKCRVYDLREKGLAGTSGRITSMHITRQNILCMGGHRSLYLYDISSGEKRSLWVPGEVQAIGSYERYVYLGIYEGAELWKFRPDNPYRIQGDSRKDNPFLVGSLGANQSRPHGKIIHYNNYCIMGTSAYPGGLTGAVGFFDERGTNIKIIPFKNYNVNCISAWNGMLAVGTSITGEGASPKARHSKVFILSLNDLKILYDFIPVLDQEVIYSLANSRNLLYGMTKFGYIFCFDITARKILWTEKVCDKIQYNSNLGCPNLISDYKGDIFGTNGKEFFKLNTRTRKIESIAKGVTGYMSVSSDNSIFLNIGAHLFRYDPAK